MLVHWEGNNNLHRTVQRAKALGKRVGVVINPATPAEVLEEILPDVDQVLVMTVNPGFGHQHFIDTTLPKIRRVREMIERVKPGCDLEVDGGIDATTAPLVVEAGANVLVAGSAVFGAADGVAAAMKRLRAAAAVHQRVNPGVDDATRNDRPRPDGREHGAAAHQGRPRLRGVRHVAEGGGGAREGEGDRRRPRSRTS